VQNFSPGRQGMMHERALRHALARSTGRCRAVVIRRARRKGIGGGGAGGAGGGEGFRSFVDESPGARGNRVERH
jgi:hypothetical protein